MAHGNICKRDDEAEIASNRRQGQTLRQALSGRAWPGGKVVDYALQIARGLAAAHDRGVVHGALSPENLFVTADGHVNIRQVEVQAPSEPVRLRATPGLPPEKMLGTALGTVDYLSPEQVRGAAVDHRSDIFSFGAILYEMISGRRAFKGSTPTEVMAAILAQAPQEFPAGDAAGVSPELVGIVNRCLDKDVETRFQTAHDVASALAGQMTVSGSRSQPVQTLPPARASNALVTLQYRLLRRLWPEDPPAMMHPVAYEQKSKLDVLLGPMLGDLRGKTVIDFGCGYGLEAIDLVRFDPARVIGLDLSFDHLAIARRCVQAAGMSDVIELTDHTDVAADAVICLDSFEHFDDPGAILSTMYELLRPGGQVFISFGPTWYHPLGGHLFSVFPWAHLIFSETALLRWREDRRREGLDSFRAAGLNQMTIGRFERLIKRSPFQVEHLETVPIRRFRRFHNRLTREFLTSIVRCRLRRGGCTPPATTTGSIDGSK
jgi:2-polyprenyl-3-methyl-5-hydroxy-6-metoxy-1,4-benzoquinol methylase